MSDPDPDHVDLAAGLARDAQRWGGAPSEAARAALRARLRTAARPRPFPLRPILWLAASALVAAWLFWPRPTARAPSPPAVPALRAEILAASAADRALAPLQVELKALGDDGVALARGLWRRVPGPVRVLLDRSE
jgi:hypothetical protein